MKKRLGREIAAGVLSAAVGAMAVFSRKVYFSPWVGLYTDRRDIWFEAFEPADLLWWLLFSAAAHAVFRGILFLMEKKPPGRALSQQKGPFLLFLAILFLAQLPCLLSFFPGGIYADTIPSLLIARGEAPLSNRQPVLYAFYWKIFVEIGRLLALPETAVFFLHTLSIAVFYALSGAYFLSVLCRHGTAKVLTVFLTAYLALFPLIPLYVVSLWKDTPFALAVFALSTFLYDHFSEGWEHAGDWLRRPKSVIFYALLAFLVIFLRNNAVYAFVLFSLTAFLCLLHFNRPAGRHFGLLSLALLLPLCTLRGAISSSAESVESLGIPLQQVGYVLDQGGEIAEEDLAFLSRILPVERWKEVYRPLVVDVVKWDEAFDNTFFREHTGEFLRVWLRIVGKNFPAAVKGYALATVGFWDPTRQMTHGYVCNFMWEGEDLPLMRDLPEEWTGFSLRGIYDGLPLFSAALFAWAVLILTVLGTIRHGRPSFLAAVPGLGIWLTVLVATPIAFSLRYLFPMVLLVPAALAVFFEPPLSGKKTR